MDEPFINYGLELTNDEGIINVNIMNDSVDFYFTTDRGEQQEPLRIPRDKFEWFMRQYAKFIPTYLEK